MMTTADAVMKIERTIKSYLLVRRRFNDQIKRTGDPNFTDDYTVPVLEMYSHIAENSGFFGVVTTGFFNRIVAEMKRTGIIGTAKGGDIMFLSNAAWDMEQRAQAKRDKAAAEKRNRLADHDASGGQHCGTDCESCETERNAGGK